MALNNFYMIGSGGSNLNAGSTASGTPIYTSASGNWSTSTNQFTPTDGSTPASTVAVNDWLSIYPNGNTTTPYIAQVTVVASGANGAITVSSTIKFGTAPTTASGTISVIDGGAWADFGMVASGVALTTGTVPVSTQINILAGTYANTTTNRTLALVGTTTLPLIWQGYKTTIGDQHGHYTAVAGTDIPSITFTTGRFLPSGAFQVFRNLAISGAATLSQFGISGSSIQIIECQITNTSTAPALATAASTYCALCYFSASSGNCVSIASPITQFDGCYFTGGALSVSGGSNATTNFNSCIFTGQTSDAIQFSTGYGNINNCSFYGSSSSGNGINWTGTPGAIAMVRNCYFSTFTTAAKAAINNTSGTNTGLIHCIANAYFNCTSNVSGVGDFPLIFDNGTLGAEAFIAAGTNFAVSPEAWAIGMPAGFETISAFRPYNDLGAVHHIQMRRPRLRMGA